jgi:hypothetical protein
MPTRPLPSPAPFALLAVALFAVACGGDKPLPGPLPVAGGAAAPVSFTESTFVEPFGAAGSRFGKEWTVGADARGRRTFASPDAGGTIELVRVDFRPQTLVLEVAPDVAPVAPISPIVPERKLTLSFDHRPMGSFPLAGQIRVGLPRDLPIGRVVLDLRADPPGPIVLASAAVSPALPAGAVRLDGRDVVQAGSTLLYLDRFLTRDDAVLTGTFVPPHAPHPGQIFELVLERDDGTPIRRFDWSPSFWNRVRGARDFDLPMGDAKGRIRARFRAVGDGPPARWKDLRYTWVAERSGVMSGPAPAAPNPPQSNLPRGSRP